MLSFFDDHPSQHLVPGDAVLVGLCTGLLAAIAVSASQSILDLIDNALKVARIAFRVGVKVHDTARRLFTIDDVQADRSWSKLVVGIQKEACAAKIKDFNKRKV